MKCFFRFSVDTVFPDWILFAILYVILKIPTGYHKFITIIIFGIVSSFISIGVVVSRCSSYVVQFDVKFVSLPPAPPPPPSSPKPSPTLSTEIVSSTVVTFPTTTVPLAWCTSSAAWLPLQTNDYIDNHQTCTGSRDRAHAHCKTARRVVLVAGVDANGAVPTGLSL